MPSPAGREPVRPRCCLRTEGSECRGGGRGGGGTQGLSLPLGSPSECLAVLDYKFMVHMLPCSSEAVA